MGVTDVSPKLHMPLVDVLTSSGRVLYSPIRIFRLVNLPSGILASASYGSISSMR